MSSTETKTVVERVRYNKIKIVITIIVKRYSCITRDIAIYTTGFIRVHVILTIV